MRTSALRTLLLLTVTLLPVAALTTEECVALSDATLPVPQRDLYAYTSGAGYIHWDVSEHLRNDKVFLSETTPRPVEQVRFDVWDQHETWECLTATWSKDRGQVFAALRASAPSEDGYSEIVWHQPGKEQLYLLSRWHGHVSVMSATSQGLFMLARPAQPPGITEDAVPPGLHVITGQEGELGVHQCNINVAFGGDEFVDFQPRSLDRIEVPPPLGKPDASPHVFLVAVVMAQRQGQPSAEEMLWVGSVGLVSASDCEIKQVATLPTRQLPGLVYPGAGDQATSTQHVAVACDDGNGIWDVVALTSPAGTPGEPQPAGAYARILRLRFSTAFDTQGWLLDEMLEVGRLPPRHYARWVTLTMHPVTGTWIALGDNGDVFYPRGNQFDLSETGPRLSQPPRTIGSFRALVLTQPWRLSVLQAGLVWSAGVWCVLLVLWGAWWLWTARERAMLRRMGRSSVTSILDAFASGKSRNAAAAATLPPATTNPRYVFPDEQPSMPLPRASDINGDDGDDDIYAGLAPHPSTGLRVDVPEPPPPQPRARPIKTPSLRDALKLRASAPPDPLSPTSPYVIDLDTEEYRTASREVIDLGVQVRALNTWYNLVVCEDPEPDALKLIPDEFQTLPQLAAHANKLLAQHDRLMRLVEEAESGETYAPHRQVWTRLATQLAANELLLTEVDAKLGIMYPTAPSLSRSTGASAAMYAGA